MSILSDFWSNLTSFYSWDLLSHYFFFILKLFFFYFSTTTFFVFFDIITGFFVAFLIFLLEWSAFFNKLEDFKEGFDDETKDGYKVGTRLVLFDENWEDFSEGLFESNKVTESGDDGIKEDLFDRETDGFFDRIIYCDKGGIEEGLSDGIIDESIDGVAEKDNDGMKEGLFDGGTDGFVDWVTEGGGDGFKEELFDGIIDGLIVEVTEGGKETLNTLYSLEVNTPPDNNCIPFTYTL